MKLYDAHNHLQQLRAHEAEVMPVLTQEGVAGAVVNGTHEADWEEVQTLAQRYPRVRPAFGLHPWQVQTRSSTWRERLAAVLKGTPGSTVGEIGLDRWVQGYHWAAQQECFRAQLQLATAHDVAATIHCLKAWGALLEILQDEPLPSCGVLIHAYGGPREMVAPLVKQGAYFSFNAYFLQARKAAQQTVFAEVIPLDRLLVETDAPAMLPPPQARPYRLATSDGEEPNHPGNLRAGYEALAALRRIPLEELAGAVEANFERLFGRGH